MPRPSQLDTFINQFASVIATRVEAILAKSTRGARGRPTGGAGKKRSFPCPYPGCKNPGNGPRNRWFCEKHQTLPVREQKRILAERAKSGGAALTVRRRGPSPMKGRRLDLHCRVEGCKNMSRGPRFGFICDDHRKKLSAKEQQAARDKWKAAHAKKAA